MQHQATKQRPTVAEIHLDRLEANWQCLRQVHGKGRLMAVVKANAYGHGLATTALFLQGLGQHYFGVALLDEALTLRQAGITGRILVLGPPEPMRWHDYQTHNIEATIPSLAHLQQAAAHLNPLRNKPEATHTPSQMGSASALRIHLKVDTGMHRVGWTTPPDTPLVTLLKETPNLVVQGVYSHLACADNVRATQNQAQYTAFLNWVEAFLHISQGFFSPELHFANSAGLLQNPRFHFDYARVGYALWGPLAFATSQNQPQANGQLRNVLAWRTRISHLKCLPHPGRVGYGALQEVDAGTWVATLPVGYADGYPRNMYPKAKVLIHGIRWPLVGMVSMDQTCVVLPAPTQSSTTAHAPQHIALGDEVVLLGGQGGQTISPHEAAQWCHEIGYTLLCGIRSRVPRAYLYNGKPWMPPPSQPLSG